MSEGNYYGSCSICGKSSGCHSFAGNWTDEAISEALNRPCEDCRRMEVLLDRLIERLQKAGLVKS